MMQRNLRAWAIVFAVSILLFPAAAESPIEVDRAGNRIVLGNDGATFEVSLRSPEIVLEGGESVGGVAPETIAGDLASGDGIAVTYPAIELPGGAPLHVTAYIQWLPRESLLRKWAQVRLGRGESRRVNEVILDRAPVEGRDVRLDAMPPQSYPAMLPGFFAGIEFPIARTRIEGDTLLLAHAPGVTLQPGVTYTTRTAVVGLAPPGREMQAFKDYVARNRPTPTGLHVNYNSWWTSSVPFTEEEILGIMKSFEGNLYTPHGVALDTFTIDMGWSDPQSLWEIGSERFPQGFTNIQESCERMGATLGLWISPSCFYSPGAVDTVWAEENGYETQVIASAGGETRICCLGGARYAEAFQERLVDMITGYTIRHVKLDGYYLTCPETDHGHAPGPLSSEAIAEGGIAAFQGMRAAAPDVWLEATCFGWNPSPWWLFYVNSVIGTFGDDAPHGRVPAPMYRDSYTTARDYFNLQGAALLNVPIVAQEVLGIIHQTDDDFMNDAVDVIMRGHAFLTMYVNPKYMNERRWKSLAECIRWARNNPILFQHTEPILPASWQNGKAPRFTNDASMPRQPYGYAHWGDTQGLVALRNPWIAPASITLTIGGHNGLADASEALSAISLYPEVRVYGTNLANGDVLDVTLAPYETLVLSIAANQPVDALPEAAGSAANAASIVYHERRVSRVVYEDSTDPGMGADWTALTAPGGEAMVCRLEADFEVTEPLTRLLILLEGGDTPSWPTRLVCTADGVEVPFRLGSSDAGWAASSIPAGAEHWQFIEADLPPGRRHLSLDLVAGTDCARASVWAYVGRAGNARADFPNALPPPEFVPVSAVPMLDSAEFEPSAPEVRPVVIERIDGIYLDALSPVSATQGWGELQKNHSVTETPMSIGGRKFRRGLGTHAVSNLTYELDGAFKRFHAFVGPQYGRHGTVTFQVVVDGSIVWESGPMTDADDAKLVDVDVAGARKLELIVGDGGNGIGADHANWADAKLLH